MDSGTLGRSVTRSRWLGTLGLALAAAGLTCGGGGAARQGDAGLDGAARDGTATRTDGGADSRRDARGDGAVVFTGPRLVDRLVSGGTGMRSSRFQIVGAMEGNGGAVSASPRFELQAGSIAATQRE
jgi:hypothetical protein